MTARPGWLHSTDPPDLRYIGGAIVVPGQETTKDGPKVRPEQWQSLAWEYWADLGELNYPTSYIARQVSRVEWEAVDDKGEPRADSAEIIAEVTEGIGPEEAARQIALNLEVAGEGNYIQREEGEKFEVISTDMPRRDEILRTNDDGTSTLNVNKRFYTPDPRDTRKAISALRPALGPAEELLTFQALSRAQARSRIPAGMLLVPKEQSFSGEGDPFSKGLEQAMTLAIADVTHPAAFAPIKVTMAAELIDKVRHLTFDRPYDDKIDQKIMLATKRIALALDIPAELLLGLADVNHWTGWLVSDETYTAHVGPLAVDVADVFASVWEKLHEGEFVEIRPNPAALLARRSSVRDAFDAYELGVISGEYVREVMGADEQNAPDEAELARRLNRDPTVAENPGAPTTGLGATVTGVAEAKQLAEIIQKIYLGVNVVVTVDEARQILNAAGAGLSASPFAVAAAMDGQIDLDEMAAELAALDVQLRDTFVGATEQTGIRAMEKIGARARSEARTDPVLREKLADLALADIGPALGSQQLVALGVDVTRIVDESVDALISHWERRLIAVWHQIDRLGIRITADLEPPTQSSSEVLRDGVSKWIIGNLDRDEPAAAPTDVIRLAVAKAGGQ